MVALKNACFCFTLRTGNLILGWLHLIGGIIAIIAVASAFPVVEHMKDSDLPEGVTKADIKAVLGIIIALACISPIIAICHLYGSYKYRRGFLLPYLIGGGIQLALFVIGVIFSIAKLRASEIISQVIALVIFVYLYLIPWSFYKELKEGRSPGMPQA